MGAPKEESYLGGWETVVKKDKKSNAARKPVKMSTVKRAKVNIVSRQGADRFGCKSSTLPKVEKKVTGITFTSIRKCNKNFRKRDQKEICNRFLNLRAALNDADQDDEIEKKMRTIAKNQQFAKILTRDSPLRDRFSDSSVKTSAVRPAKNLPVLSTRFSR